MQPEDRSDYGSASGLDVLRWMRRDAQDAQVGHELPGVAALLGPSVFW